MGRASLRVAFTYNTVRVRHVLAVWSRVSVHSCVTFHLQNRWVQAAAPRGRLEPSTVWAIGSVLLCMLFAHLLVCIAAVPACTPTAPCEEGPV